MNDSGHTLPLIESCYRGSKRSEKNTQESLLQELLKLDKSYEAGKIKKAAYQDQRARLKARLRLLMDEQPAEQKIEATGKRKGSK